jgi:hypothetical protein
VLNYHRQTGSPSGASFGGGKWLLSQKSSRAFPATPIEIETLKTIVTLCGAGLLASRLLTMNGWM